VAATATALPSNGERCGADDGHTIVVCGSAGEMPETSGGSGSAGSHAGPATHVGSSGPVRTTPPGGGGGDQDQPREEAPRPLSDQPQGCGDCQALFQTELFRSLVTKDACVRAGEAMATDLCQDHRLLPNGDIVDEYSCPARGPCEGPGIQRCMDAYRRGMRASAVAEGRNAGFNLPFTVPVSGGANRTETSSWNATQGYLISCHHKAMEIRQTADIERTMCGRRVLQGRGGVCTF
jgi:hypothetical protein